MISVVRGSEVNNTLEVFLRPLLTIYDLIFCRGDRYSFQFRERFISLLGNPGTSERRRFWVVAIALVAVFLLTSDPWRARRVLERPAYEAFQRRRNLLRWSTPDIIDGILTYYLTNFMYFI